MVKFVGCALRGLVGAALFVLFQVVWSPVGSVSPASAQTTCPDQTITDPANILVHGNLADGTCVAGGAQPANGFQLAINFGNDFVIRGRDASAFENATSLTCPGGSVGAGQVVSFAGAGACSMTATFDIGGTIVTVTADLAADGGGPEIFTATNILITGGAFGFPADGLTAQDKSSTTAALQDAFNAATPGALDGLPLNGTVNGAANGFSLAPSALGVASSSMDNGDPFTRRFGLAGDQHGILGLAQQRSNKGFNFSVDLQSLMARARGNGTADAAALHNDGGKDLAGPPPRSRWNIWASGRYVDFEDDERNADRDGDLWWVVSGLSLQLGERTTVGAFSRYREGEVDSTALNAKLDAEYYGGGVFLATTLGGGLRVVGAALIEHGDSDVRIDGATGSFDTEQVTLEGRISKRFTRGRLWIEPGVKVLWTDADNDDYTDSAGVAVVGRDLTLGRLTYGPTIGTTIDHGSVRIKPFAKVHGLWDFETEGNFTTSTGVVFSSADSAINLGGGVAVAYASGLFLKIGGDWFAFDTDLEGWAISGGIGVPLSVFGFGGGAPGFVSLDFTGREQDASLGARLRIPLN